MHRQILSEFRYVEFASKRMPGFRNLVVDVRQVGRLARKYGRFDAYTSMYLYPERVIEYVQSNLRGGKPSISGYDGQIYANYLFFDIDAARLGDAQNVAKKLVDFLYRKWGIERHGVTVAYSGNRGFHLGIDRRVFGIVRASKSLNRAFALVREKIPELAGLEENEKKLIDYSISDKTRLWRLINTRNAKSGLFKIPLTPDELWEFSEEKTRKVARSPRACIFTDETGLFPRFDVSACQKAADLYKDVMNLTKRQEKRLQVSAIEYEINDLRPLNDVLCKARHNLLNSRVPKGQRNNSALILVSSFRSGGYSEDRAREIIFKWNAAKRIGLDERELENVVKSVYRTPRAYSFGCNSLRGFCPYKDRRECADYRRFRVLTSCQ